MSPACASANSAASSGATRSPRQEGGQITVFGKGGKTRTVLLKPKAWQQLLSIKGDATAVDAIFRSRKGGGALDLSQVRIVYAAAKRAGLEQKVSPHWLRHAHASHALDRSVPIHLVQATLGHASVFDHRSLPPRPADRKLQLLPAGLELQAATTAALPSFTYWPLPACPADGECEP